MGAQLCLFAQILFVSNLCMLLRFLILIRTIYNYFRPKLTHPIPYRTRRIHPFFTFCSFVRCIIMRSEQHLTKTYKFPTANKWARVISTHANRSVAYLCVCVCVIVWKQKYLIACLFFSGWYGIGDWQKKKSNLLSQVIPTLLFSASTPSNYMNTIESCILCWRECLDFFKDIS